MSGHTPGPWTVPHFARGEDVKCDCGYVFSEFQQGMGSICEVHFAGENEPIAIATANARLIAASPVLLAVLRELCRQAESSLDYRPEFRSALADGLAAINQAEGMP